MHVALILLIGAAVAAALALGAASPWVALIMVAALGVVLWMVPCDVTQRDITQCDVTLSPVSAPATETARGAEVAPASLGTIAGSSWNTDLTDTVQQRHVEITPTQWEKGQRALAREISLENSADDVNTITYFEPPASEQADP